MWHALSLPSAAYEKNWGRRPLRRWADDGRTWVRRAAATLRHWVARAGQRHALADLDERLLQDIGKTRVEALREAAKPFWR